MNIKIDFLWLIVYDKVSFNEGQYWSYTVGTADKPGLSAKVMQGFLWFILGRTTGTCWRHGWGYCNKCLLIYPYLAIFERTERKTEGEILSWPSKWSIYKGIIYDGSVGVDIRVLRAWDKQLRLPVYFCKLTASIGHILILFSLETWGNRDRNTSGLKTEHRRVSLLLF